MKHIHATILAAGKSTRFNAPFTKLSAPLSGKPLVRYPVDMLREMHIPMTLVLGYQADHIHACMPDDPLITYTHQTEQRGTGHALICAYNQCSARHTLVLNGDTPLITQDLIRTVIHEHIEQQAAVTFVTTDNSPQTYAYGKVVIDETGYVSIVEARHAEHPRDSYTHVNAGIYLFSSTLLQEALTQLLPHDGSNEIYITDLIGYASKYGYTVSRVHTDFDTVRGVNTLEELQVAEQRLQTTKVTALIHDGVYCQAPEHTYIDNSVTISPHTWIEPGAIIRGTTTIGPRCRIGAYAVIDNCHIASDVTIAPYTHCTNATIHENAQIGPFAHLRKNNTIHEHAMIGNFVEVASSTIGPAVKAKHLSYIGNTHIDHNANIGAGTVICNFDGTEKHNTHIAAHAFVGSNTTLVAPLQIGSNTIIGAGSVITTDVPDNALAIARERETIKPEYVTRKHTRQHTQYQTAEQTTDKQDMTV